MKKKNILYYWTVLSVAVFATACSSPAGQRSEGEDPIAITGIDPVLNELERSADAQTRATVNGFAVNTSADPTHDAISSRSAWLLDFTIYKGTAVYPDGQGTYNWGSGDTWVPRTGNTYYFPNYLSQNITARLYPDGWSAIATVQNTKTELLGQDILIQNGLPYLKIAPAHKPRISMQHANSMLDFVINGVSSTQISEISVITSVNNADVTYAPLLLDASDVSGRTEYMVIIPTGITNPRIRLKTSGGATYIQTVAIASTAVNKCYCFVLEGVDLSLTAVTVTDWKVGEGIPGEYSAITTYPTFRGPATDYVNLTYDNGLTQRLTFSQDGEVTLKPSGRTIIRIENSTGGILELDNSAADKAPIVLRSMYIDLRPYLARI